MSIETNIESIKEKLPEGVKLVAVSKFHPLEAILEAYQCGQRAFGENRPQELAAKAVQLPQDIEWHFLGHLQTNKLKMVLPYASLVQSVDTLHLLQAIDEWGGNNGKVIDVLLELHIGAEETKQGFVEEEILDLLFTVANSLKPISAALWGWRRILTTKRPSVQTSLVSASSWTISATFSPSFPHSTSSPSECPPTGRWPSTTVPPSSASAPPSSARGNTSYSPSFA